MKDCKLIQFPEISDGRGSLSFIEGGPGHHIPFEIKRIFYIYNVLEDRGKHAHKTVHQLILALHGSFDVELDDGLEKKIIHLSRPSEGIWIVPGIWNNLTHFSSKAVCLVLTSDYFRESDYIRDYDEFIKYADSMRKTREEN